MWQALRTEFSYSRPFLFGSLAVAAAVTALIATIFALFPSPPPSVAASILAIYPLLGPCIVSFISQGHRSEERRSRLLLAGALTPRQIVLAWVTLPLIFLGVGIAATTVFLGFHTLLTGSEVTLDALQSTLYVGGLMVVAPMLALLCQEALAAFRQRRRQASALGWGLFVGGILFLTGVAAWTLYARGRFSWQNMHLANLLVAGLAMAATVRLYVTRADFTR